MSAAWFHYFSIAFKLTDNWNKLFKTLHYWSRDMLNFHFLNKSLGIMSPAHFVYDFLTKVYLMLYSINWPNLIAWLSLLLKILGKTCIVIVCCPACDVMDFEINLIFQIEPFFQHDWKVVTKTKISWERKELLRWYKKHFSSFLKGFQLTKIV